MTAAIPSTWLGRLREIKSLHGNWAAMQLVIDRLGKRLVNLSIVNVVRLESQHLAKIQAADPDFTFRFLSPSEVAQFATEPRNDLPAEFAERAAAGCDLCFAALSGDRLAAYGWYALGSIEPQHCDNLGMSFPAHMAYMYKGFTHTDFRGKRLHGLVMGLALKELASRGVTELISTVDWTNWPSLKSCYRLGYSDLGRIVRIGPSCCPIVFAPRAAKRLGVKFGRRADLSGRS